LFAPDQGIKVIDALQEARIRVWSLEAFKLIGPTGIQPHTEFSLNIPFESDDPWHAARAHLKAMVNTEFMFEIWADDED
jgi:hypothetical protein